VSVHIGMRVNQGGVNEAGSLGLLLLLLLVLLDLLEVLLAVAVRTRRVVLAARRVVITLVDYARADTERLYWHPLD
jgi:hypothetical protein